MLKVGSVIRAYFPEMLKVKRFVVAGISLDRKHALVVVINSELAQFILDRPYLRRLQLALPCAGREEYLDHDSFLNCASLFTRDFRLLEQELRQSPHKLVGQLSNSDISTMLKAILESPDLSEDDIENFGL